MASWNVYLQNEGFEKLKEARNLTEVASKDDPEDNPYRSMYKAREILQAVKKSVKKLTDKNERHSKENLIFLWAALELRLGILSNSIYELPTIIVLNLKIAYYTSKQRNHCLPEAEQGLLLSDETRTNYGRINVSA